MTVATKPKVPTPDQLAKAAHGGTLAELLDDPRLTEDGIRESFRTGPRKIASALPDGLGSAHLEVLQEEYSKRPCDSVLSLLTGLLGTRLLEQRKKSKRESQAAREHVTRLAIRDRERALQNFADAEFYELLREQFGNECPGMGSGGRDTDPHQLLGHISRFGDFLWECRVCGANGSVLDEALARRGYENGKKENKTASDKA